MERLKRATLRALLDELEDFYDEDSSWPARAEARQNAERCIKILHEIGMPEDVLLPGDGVAMIGLSRVERFVVEGFHAAGADARSEVLDILKNRAFEKMEF